MNINLEDYLSESEIKNMVAEEFRMSLQRHFKEESNMQRILTNTAYYTYYEQVNRITDGGAEKIINEKFQELLAKDMHFSMIFKGKDVWDREETPAYKILMKAVTDNQVLIAEKVKDCISNLPKKDIQPTIKQAILEKISRMFV